MMRRQIFLSRYWASLALVFSFSIGPSGLGKTPARGTYLTPPASAKTPKAATTGTPANPAAPCETDLLSETCRIPAGQATPEEVAPALVPATSQSGTGPKGEAKKAPSTATNAAKKRKKSKS